MQDKAYVNPIMNIRPINNNSQQENKQKHKKQNQSLFSQDDDTVELSGEQPAIIDKIYDDRTFIDNVNLLSKKLSL